MKKKLHLNMYMKILLLCTLSILAALFLLAALFSYSSAGTIYEQSKETNIQLLKRLQDEVSAKIQDIEDTLISVYNETELMQDLTIHLDNKRMKENHFREAYSLAQHFDVQDGVVAIYFYDDFNRLFSTYRRVSAPVDQYPEDPFTDGPGKSDVILRKFILREKSRMMISSYYNEYGQNSIIRFAVNIFSQDGRQNQIGAVVCDVDSADFLNILEKYHIQADNVLWLQPSGDRVAVQIGDSSETSEQIMAAISAGKQEEELQSLVNGQVLFCLPMELGQLTLYSLMPQTMLMKNQVAIIKSLITIAVAMLFAVAFLSMLFARGITKPLAALTGTMRRIQAGETELRVKNLGSDEIGELGANFNQMLDQMKELLVKEYITKLSLQKAQYNALQAQINPHFLYNTLESMSSIAQISGCDQVSDLSESLARIFRYTLDMSSNYSTVEKELIHLKNYIQVMDVRMPHEIQYNYDIEESALSWKIPKLTLQPIVENAINHGVRGVRHEKIINISIRLENDNLIICVSDNGQGFDAEEINRRLLMNDREDVEKGRSIGLVNINARLRMLCGDACGIRVESTEGEGTKVWVRLSKMMEGGKKDD